MKKKLVQINCGQPQALYFRFNTITQPDSMFANINVKNKFDNTPLIWAAINGHFEVVRFLQDKGG